jgi:anti-sigma regulatory factor (Ser/Thr protein kinase)
MKESIRLPGDPTSAHAARTFVGETLETWRVGAYVLEAAVLLTSELVTNAILHAQSPVRVIVSSGLGSVTIGISDDSEQLPSRQAGGDDLGGGRGLQIVEALASRWGTSRNEDGKTVWFELASGQRPRRLGAGGQAELASSTGGTPPTSSREDRRASLTGSRGTPPLCS